jgi:hypothetical protein
MGRQLLPGTRRCRPRPYPPGGSSRNNCLGYPLPIGVQLDVSMSLSREISQSVAAFHEFDTVQASLMWGRF